jgi:hypothetical protein
MQPAKAKTHLWYLFRLLHDRSTVLLCAVGVIVLHGIVLFAPTLMAPRGDALYRSLVYLSFMAGDGLDCL